MVPARHFVCCSLIFITDIGRMSFKVFQSIVSKTLEDGDVDAVNSLYLKLKDRLTDLIKDPTADQNGLSSVDV